MKIITRATIDWATLAVEAEESFEYDGPLTLAKDSGSAPTPVDPWTQAAAQYGLSTGTASYNAGLNRTNQTNPLGSSTWSTNQGQPSAGASSGVYDGSALPPVMPDGRVVPQVTAQNNFGVPTGTTPGAGAYPGGSGAGATGPYIPPGPYAPGAGGSGLPYGLGGAPPTYTLNTQLDPQFNSELQKPIDTSGIAGMPGGPSTTQDLQTTRDSLYKAQQQYLQPEQALQSEQLKSQLANEGATPGSAAYNNEMDRLSREQEFANSNARTSAITGGGAEQSRLFGLGSQSLADQITKRNAPISEFNALSGAPGSTATALTPDISGAFGQQYQGQLAGYNADVASNNATTSTVGSLAAMLAIYF